MLISFRNLCMSNIDDVLAGETRDNGHIASVINAVYLRPAKFGRKDYIDGFVIIFDAENGPDPKAHFLDKEIAEGFYFSMIELLGKNITNDDDAKQYAEVDVLAYGAL